MNLLAVYLDLVKWIIHMKSCRTKEKKSMLTLISILCTGIHFWKQIYPEQTVLTCVWCVWKHALSWLGMTFVPPYNNKVFKSCLLGIKSVVYIKRGPRSGIFSVYILRNVDYILLTYSSPWFCVQFFFLFNYQMKILWFAHLKKIIFPL